MSCLWENLGISCRICGVKGEQNGSSGRFGCNKGHCDARLPAQAEAAACCSKGKGKSEPKCAQQSTTRFRLSQQSCARSQQGNAPPHRKKGQGMKSLAGCRAAEALPGPGQRPGRRSHPAPHKTALTGCSSGGGGSFFTWCFSDPSTGLRRRSGSFPECRGRTRTCP